MSNIEIMDRGISALLKALGAVETERFISIINSEKFDYTKWQRTHFDGISADDFFDAAIKYQETNPF